MDVITDDTTGDIRSAHFSCAMMFCDLTVNLPAKFEPGDSIEKLFMKIDNIDFNKHSGGNLKIGADEITYVVRLAKENGRWVLKIQNHVIKKVLISAKRVFNIPTGIKRNPAPKFYGPDDREISGIRLAGNSDENRPSAKEQEQLVKVLPETHPQALVPESPSVGQAR